MDPTLLRALPRCAAHRHRERAPPHTTPAYVDAKARAPIDAVGAQAHDAYKLPLDTVKQFLDKLASETGLPVYITEDDLDVADDAKQREVMATQFPLFWKHPQVQGITLWGYVSGAT